MRIGITCYPTVGGSGTVANELGLHLARRDHEVHFIAQRLLMRPDEFHENVRFHEVDRTSLGLFDDPPNDLALAAKMADVARESRLELLHVHYAIPYAVTGFLAQQLVGDAAPRLVTTLHGTDITLIGQDRSFYELTRFGIERSDAVTAVSEFLRKTTEDELAGEEADRGDPELHRPSGLRAGPRVQGPGRVRGARREDPAARVEPPAGQARRRRGAHLRAREPRGPVGPADDRRGAGARPRAARSRAGWALGERVRFLGQPDSAGEVTGLADVFLLPSELESFGLAALEAMACGVPVVGSDAGGLPEVVRHAETGYLLPVGDVEGMAARSIEILKDDEHRREMGRAGRRRAAALFSADRVVSQYERLYERALGG